MAGTSHQILPPVTSPAISKARTQWFTLRLDPKSPLKLNLPSPLRPLRWRGCTLPQWSLSPMRDSNEHGHRRLYQTRPPRGEDNAPLTMDPITRLVLALSLPIVLDGIQLPPGKVATRSPPLAFPIVVQHHQLPEVSSNPYFLSYRMLRHWRRRVRNGSGTKFIWASYG